MEFTKLRIPGHHTSTYHSFCKQCRHMSVSNIPDHDSEVRIDFIPFRTQGTKWYAVTCANCMATTSFPGYHLCGGSSQKAENEFQCALDTCERWCCEICKVFCVQCRKRTCRAHITETTQQYMCPECSRGSLREMCNKRKRKTIVCSDYEDD